MGSPVSIFADHHPLTRAAREWLAALQRCVRAVDYESAQPLFAPEVQAFGTYAAIVDGRDALRREQWQHIWPAIREFSFRLEEARCVGTDTLLGVVVPWDSLGVRPDGTMFPRAGRATLILIRRDAGWVAVHSHFSLAPASR